MLIFKKIRVDFCTSNVGGTVKNLQLLACEEMSIFPFWLLNFKTTVVFMLEYMLETSGTDLVTWTAN